MPIKKAKIKPSAKKVAKKAVEKKAAKPAVAKKGVKKAPAKPAQTVKKAPAKKESASPVSISKPKSIPQKSTSSAKKAAPKTAAPASVFSENYIKNQGVNLLSMKDSILDAMNGVARDSLHSRAENSEANAFGEHQADAGSDAYDRDFALNILSREQDSLYEIEQALSRIDHGVYGICENCGKTIPRARLDALPFTRFTVECQSEMERIHGPRYRHISQTVGSLFGQIEEDLEDHEEDLVDYKE